MPAVPLALFPCGWTGGESRCWMVQTEARRLARTVTSIPSWRGPCSPRRACFPWVEKERPQRSTPLKGSPGRRLAYQIRARSPAAPARRPEEPRPPRSVQRISNWRLPRPKRQRPRRRKKRCASVKLCFVLCWAWRLCGSLPLTRMAEDRVAVGKIESWKKHNELYRNTCTLHANKRRFCIILHMYSVSHFRISLISYCSLDFQCGRAAWSRFPGSYSRFLSPSRISTM